MKNRIIHISDDLFVKQNLKKLFEMFYNNGYPNPKHILKMLIYNSNISDGLTEDVFPNDNYIYKKLPFINELTNVITKIIK